MPAYRGEFYAHLPIDARVVLFHAVLLGAVSIVFGLTPALRLGEKHLQSAIAAGQSGTAGRRFQLRFVSLVAAMEVAVVVALCSSAALALKSFRNTRHRSLGFEAEHVVVARVNLSVGRYRSPARQTALIRELLDRARRIPGVERAAVSIGWELPPGGGHATTNTAQIEGRPQELASRNKAIVRNQTVSGNYFGILHIPLLRGRNLRDEDEVNAAPVVVVSEEFARRNFRGEDAIGHRIKAGERDNVWYTIVGIVGNVRSGGLASLPEPIVYTPYAQSESGRLRDLGVVLEARLPAASLAGALRTQLAAIDAEQPVSSIENMAERLDELAAAPRFTADLLGTLSILGTVLAMAGVFGVTACRAKTQMRESAVRLALGAPVRSVLISIGSRAMVICAVGSVCGFGLALVAVRALSTLLFQVNWRDPWPVALVVICILAAALAATLPPAWKASHADPLTVLREN